LHIVIAKSVYFFITLTRVTSNALIMKFITGQYQLLLVLIFIIILDLRCRHLIKWIWYVCIAVNTAHSRNYNYHRFELSLVRLVKHYPIYYIVLKHLSYYKHYLCHASFHLIYVPLAKCDYLVLSRNATHYVYGIPPSTPFRVITRQCWDVSCIPMYRAAFVYPLRLTECFYTRASRRLPASRRWMFRESAFPSNSFELLITNL